MIRKSFGRNTTLAGMAALALAGSPALAATGPGNPASAPDRPVETCANSTNWVQQLATIDNDDTRHGDFQCLGLSLEGDTVKAIRLETHSFAPTGSHAVADRVTIAEFSVAVVESSHGAVLDGIPGHDAIILQGHFSSPPRRTELMISYLYNGFTSEYHSCQITLDRASTTGWHLINRFDQTVSHIVVRTRQIPLFGTIGIATLDGACT